MDAPRGNGPRTQGSPKTGGSPGPRHSWRDLEMIETDPRWRAAAPKRVRDQWVRAAVWLLIVPIVLFWSPYPHYWQVPAAIAGFHGLMSLHYRRQALREADRTAPPSA